jgi:NAD(P)-dependent dehydrogenase (short-subunit alcohol dehydrogenase family)
MQEVVAIAAAGCYIRRHSERRGAAKGKSSVSGEPTTIDVSARFPDLAGKVAIVTGASRGIGVGIAEVLGRQGMKLVLTARSEEAGKRVAARLTGAGVTCLWVTADLATPDGAQRVFDETMRCFGGVDLLVNNAALRESRPFLKLDEQTYHETFERNVRMIYELSLRVARQMTERRRGCIIHISSVGGLRAHRGLAGYDTSKGAIDTLTRVMALDLGPHGIRVNAVAPGQIRGPQFRKLDGVPLGRCGTPRDIGAAVAFLASDAATYITGQVLYVDGGLTAQLTPPGIFI